MPPTTDHLRSMLLEAAAAPDELDSLIGVAHLAVDSASAPPLDQDPTAIMLGLVADPATQLDPAALKAALARSRLTLSQLVAALAQRGWDVSTAQAFSWQNTAPALPPAMLAAIADITHTSADRITRTRTAACPSQVERLRTTGRFRDLVERWARTHSIGVPQAQAMVEARLVAAVHRGAEPDDDAALGQLEAVLDVLDERP